MCDARGAGVGELALADTYESVWTTRLSITARQRGHLAGPAHWVNEGLMTFFFLVVGLEAKRELDAG